ncbi:hypothetical protein J7L05_06045 [bacterium]|nr:hypothetical protein [bacterium]
MNKNQLIAMWIGIALFILMGLFPPFIDCRLAEDGIYKFRGFHFYVTSGIRYYDAKIDYYRLRHQWLLLVVLTVGMIITAGQSGKPVKSKRQDE